MIFQLFGVFCFNNYALLRSVTTWHASCPRPQVCVLVRARSHVIVFTCLRLTNMKFFVTLLINHMARTFVWFRRGWQAGESFRFDFFIHILPEVGWRFEGSWDDQVVCCWVNASVVGFYKINIKRRLKCIAVRVEQQQKRNIHFVVDFCAVVWLCNRFVEVVIQTADAEALPVDNIPIV